MGNIMFVIKLVKDWTQTVLGNQWEVEEEVPWFRKCFLQQELVVSNVTWRRLDEWMQERSRQNTLSSSLKLKTLK